MTKTVAPEHDRLVGGTMDVFKERSGVDRPVHGRIIDTTVGDQGTAYVAIVPDSAADAALLGRKWYRTTDGICRYRR